MSAKVSNVLIWTGIGLGIAFVVVIMGTLMKTPSAWLARGCRYR